MKKLIPLFLVAAGVAMAGCSKTDNGSTTTTGSQPVSSATPAASPPDMGSASVTNGASGATNAPPPQ